MINFIILNSEKQCIVFQKISISFYLGKVIQNMITMILTLNINFRELIVTQTNYGD